MKELPESDTYEDSLLYWPYKTSLESVISHVRELAPEGAAVLDVMCGPGYLLGQIQNQRPDLSLTGVDIDERYVDFGVITYPGIRYEVGDVLTLQPSLLFDVVLCTGSLHHIPYEKQEQALASIAAMAKPGGIVIISDCYVDDYANEIERKVAAAKLGYEYLRETIENGAPDPVVGWTADILWNDVMMEEFKTSIKKRMPSFTKHFSEVRTLKTWPEAESEYGDYIHICRS